MSKKPDNPYLYEVGYGRPPIDYRFQKGQSGNPRGRPKRLATPKASLSPEICDQILELSERRLPTAGGEKTGLELQLEAEFRSGLKGDSRAQKNFIDRVSQAATERATEIRENHAYWRNYITNYRALEQTKHPIPEEWPHPDDFVFEEGKSVQIIGGDPKIAAQNRKFLIAFRDLMILKSGLDRRTISADQRDKCLQSEVITFICNSNLPDRFQLSEMALMLRLERAECTSKRMLERHIRRACDELDLPNIINIPPSAMILADARNC
jgi:hypothetical protein